MIPVNTMLKNLRSDGQKGRPAGKSDKSERKKSTFNDQLMQQISVGGRAELKKELNQLQELLGKAGEELERNPTVGNLEVFRALLSNLVGKVVKGGFQVDSVGPGWHPADRHQVIRQIDAEAEELLNLVMNEQKDRVSIARRLFNIKGLVVDLLS
ncbi:YaaR family protein [Marinospirillum sp.]|uniref:YaaR family protein n=1 Tax=Marinospirillum sp. TaxID=2183934 RepID=UPI00286FB03B|nr:YaaR family protein [Marinospirillum sp.]MDR9467130.1 YaaR family protein [Marinospirillum sp.]